MTNTINAKLVDAKWIDTFYIIKNLEKELYSELFLIKMRSN